MSDPDLDLTLAFRAFLEDVENDQLDLSHSANAAASLHGLLDDLWDEITHLQESDASPENVRVLERKIIVNIGGLSGGVRQAISTSKKSALDQNLRSTTRTRVFIAAVILYSAQAALQSIADEIIEKNRRIEFDLERELCYSQKMEENSSGTGGVKSEDLESRNLEFKYFNADGTQIGDQNLSCSKTANTHNRLDTPVQFIYEWIVRSNNVIERWLDGQVDNVEATKAASRFSRCGLGGVDVIDMIIRDRPDESEPFADLREGFEIAFEQLLLLHGATALVNYNLEKGLSASASDRRSFFEEVKRRFGGRSDALLEIPEP